MHTAFLNANTCILAAYNITECAMTMLICLPQGKDLTRIKDFVSEHLPHVILIATASQHAEVLQLYMKKLADWMVSNNAQALSGHTETGHIDVMYMDQTVAQLWENCTAGREEFPDQPVLVRRGIALGRTALHGQLPIMCSLAGDCPFILLRLSTHDCYCPAAVMM